MTSPIDILSASPIRRLDPSAARQAVVFAFATGCKVIEPLLREARPIASDFEASSFENALFVDEFCRRVMCIEIAGESFETHRAHLRSLLTHPPKDAESIAFRRTILTEVSRRPELRQQLEQSYLDLRRMFDLLETPALASSSEQHHHRISVLRALHRVIEGLSKRFADCTSGLSRLHALGVRLATGERFERLGSMLSYEDGLATVDVRVRVGVDGSVRGFELTQVRESNDSPFYRSPFGRFFIRLALWLRGYRFGELEVMARLIDEVFTPYEHDVAEMVQLLGELEFYLGALGFADLALSRGLPVSLPTLLEARSHEPQAKRDFCDLYNPLLLLARSSPKPADLISHRADALVLITGPNSGGKTRLLQAIGLAQLLAQNGLFVPARSATMLLCGGIFVSLFSEVRADQEEGRLGTELLRIRDLFEQVHPADLVLVDELCSGTNPSEAEALIRLVLELFAELRPQAFVTTHFLNFAASLNEAPPCEGMEFLKAEIDARSRPTYRFVEGVAETSLAAETAARLGVTLEELVSLVARKQAARPSRSELPSSLRQGESFDEKLFQERRRSGSAASATQAKLAEPGEGR